MKAKKSISARKLAFLRAAKTGSEAKYGIGGLEKTHKKPAPVTLPKLKFLEKEADDKI